MPVQCLICASEFQARKKPVKFNGIVTKIVKTFSDYLLVQSHGMNFGNLFSFCQACRCQYLKPVYERHTELVRLGARNAENVSRFHKIFHKINIESQLVKQSAERTAMDPPPFAVETSARAGSKLSKSLAPTIDLKYFNIPYKKLPARRGYSCSVCKMVPVKSFPEMKAHIHHIHMGQATGGEGKSRVTSYSVDKKTNRITYCGKYFCERLPNGSFKCGSCDFVGKGRLANMLGHIRMKHATAGTHDPSSRLTEVSPNKFEYRGVTAERTADGSFLCGSCPFTTKFIQSLRQHLREIHTTGRSKVCEICGKVYKNERSLYSHRLTHPTGTEQKCNKCEKSFPTRTTLWAHIVRIHKQYRPPCSFRTYVCEICGKEYKSKVAYNRHMNSTHKSSDERKKYDCKVCGKNYACYESLHTHMNSHTGRKVHACDVCGMEFTQGYSVVRHKKVVHNIVKEQTRK